MKTGRLFILFGGQRSNTLGTWNTPLALSHHSSTSPKVPYFAISSILRRQVHQSFCNPRDYLSTQQDASSSGRDPPPSNSTQALDHARPANYNLRLPLLPLGVCGSSLSSAHCFLTAPATLIVFAFAATRQPWSCFSQHRFQSQVIRRTISLPYTTHSMSRHRQIVRSSL